MNIGYSSPLPPVLGVVIAAPITPMRTPFPDLPTAQGFAAHKGEITCMVAGPPPPTAPPPPSPDLPTPQGFAAHKGEITCMVAGPGGKYVVTGGVDFQVKVREGGLG